MQTVDRSYLPLQPGQRVLDLGCGEGRHVIAAWALDGVDAVGVDLSLDDLATARERMREFRGLEGGGGPGDSAGFLLLAGDALKLPFADASFDTVICSEVLEHIPDYRSALAEISRVLKPGGRLCASVPRAWCERICWALSRDYHQVMGGHLRIFDTQRLRTEIEKHGFTAYYEHGAHALHSVYWWLQCLFWKSRERNWLVRQYHRLLVWDMMSQPAFTRVLERALNPVLGKSVVMYFRKGSE
ncbi:class I SAM-dependent methyltransferase [Congregibacter litoralis]|uniref:Methylase involved in ubiquinone/menaquinone biosynthesis n=1 Tax=Congregibacter litoralis KT71 TaxID=314285 RepID=A4A8X9_9GAMM|nr:class I SAM-dependent methyltransferase [Congregibacter litoralis]EAQ97521.1 Methylase involved in ubiquinone/menaquinone biosynthesis [Congregibacter litoralis KT71]